MTLLPELIKAQESREKAAEAVSAFNMTGGPIERLRELVDDYQAAHERCSEVWEWAFECEAGGDVSGVYGHCEHVKAWTGLCCKALTDHPSGLCFAHRPCREIRP